MTSLCEWYNESEPARPAAHVVCAINRSDTPAISVPAFQVEKLFKTSDAGKYTAADGLPVVVSGVAFDLNAVFTDAAGVTGCFPT